MKTAFRLSGKKRRIYVDFLSKSGVQSPKSPPMPVITRWFSWLEAVIHHKEYFNYYPTIVMTVQNDLLDAAGVGELVEIHSNEKLIKQWNGSYIDLWVYGKKIIKYLKMVESTV